MITNRFALLAAFAGIVALTACDTARKTEDSGGGVGACDVCHGFPPPPPATASTHPQIGECVLCHAATVDADNDLVPGGPHDDGTVDVTFTGHPGGFSSPATHGPAAIADLASCQACHGADFGGDYGPSCNACHQGAGWNAAALTTNCTFCHGTPTQPDFVFADAPQLAAPPEGVAGATAATDPAVGAHRTHLAGETYSNGFACTECHTVPSSLGHVADGAAGPELVWGALAGQGTTPAFDQGALTCTNYCHGATLEGGAGASPAWTATTIACASCHGNPPDSGEHLSHVDTLDCVTCHRGYSDTSVDPATHADGTRDVVLGDGTTISGWACGTCHTALGVSIHSATYANPAEHGPDAIAGISTCQSCHGADFGGDVGPSCNACHQSAGWNAAALATNCTFCHGTKTKPSFTFASNPPLAAPPEGVAGATAVTDPTVGAHQAHLTGGTYSTPIACAQCHVAPTDLGHIADGAAGPELAWGSLATADGATPTFTAGQTCTNYCHGSTMAGGGNKSPSFTETDLGTDALTRCSACHGSVQSGSLRGPSTGRHTSNHGNVRCYRCHGSVVARSTVTPVNSDPALVADRSLHINAARDVQFRDSNGNILAGDTWNGTTCTTTCHGGDTNTW